MGNARVAFLMVCLLWGGSVLVRADHRVLLADTTCPATKMVNRTDTWNRTDAATLKKAIGRCRRLYPASPCLVEFRKTAPNAYQAICGAKQ